MFLDVGLIKKAGRYVILGVCVSIVAKLWVVDCPKANKGADSCFVCTAKPPPLPLVLCYVWGMMCGGVVFGGVVCGAVVCGAVTCGAVVCGSVVSWALGQKSRVIPHSNPPQKKHQTSATSWA